MKKFMFAVILAAIVVFSAPTGAEAGGCSGSNCSYAPVRCIEVALPEQEWRILQDQLGWRRWWATVVNCEQDCERADPIRGAEGQLCGREGAEYCFQSPVTGWKKTWTIPQSYRGS